MSIDTGSLFVVAMVALRLSGLFAVLPFIAGNFIPRQFRLGLVVFLTILIAPLLPEQAAFPDHFLLFVVLGLKELLIGVIMGFAVRMVFFAVEFAAQVISTEMSLAASTALNPMTSQSATTLSSLLFYFTVLLLFFTGMDLEIIMSFVRSYHFIPMGGQILGVFDIGDFIAQTAYVFTLGLKMAAPIVAISFVINCVLAILGKTAPKVNILMISFAVRISVGMILFTITLDLIVQYLMQNMTGVGERMLELLVK